MPKLRKKKAKMPGNDERRDGPSGNFWTQWIKPKGAALLSKTLGPCHFVVKNCGPDDVYLLADNGDRMDLCPGDVRATYVSKMITVENRGEKWARIEFEFLPVFLKH